MNIEITDEMVRREIQNVLTADRWNDYSLSGIVRKAIQKVAIVSVVEVLKENPEIMNQLRNMIHQGMGTAMQSYADTVTRTMVDALDSGMRDIFPHE